MRVRVLWLGAAIASITAACATGILRESDDDDGDGGTTTDSSCTSCGGDGGAKDVLVGEAGCANGTTSCALPEGGATCIDTKTDNEHCGNCTNVCFANVEACEGGVCVSACGANTLCIPDGGDAAPTCANLQTDNENCGKCGVECPGDASCALGVCDCGHGTQTFNATGAQQTFVVPCGITSVTIAAYGGQGANAQDRLPSGHTGGLGGSANGTLAVTPGATLYINVGQQGSGGTGGWNGGATGGTSTAGTSCSGGPAGGGGGMSDVRVGGTALTNIVITAAGGGGSGRDYCNGTCQPCGCGGGSGGGGGATGTAGGAAYNCGYGDPGSSVNGGKGGTQSAGGAGGTGDGTGAAGTTGTQGVGGGGAAGAYDVAGGGGGGGYYGGGGGGSASSGSGVGGGGGGGGASYVGGVTSSSTSAGVQSGDGKITITW
jgi:hypothetical protein